MDHFCYSAVWSSAGLADTSCVSLSSAGPAGAVVL